MSPPFVAAAYAGLVRDVPGDATIGGKVLAAGAEALAEVEPWHFRAVSERGLDALEDLIVVPGRDIVEVFREANPQSIDLIGCIVDEGGVVAHVGAVYRQRLIDGESAVAHE